MSTNIDTYISKMNFDTFYKNIFIDLIRIINLVLVLLKTNNYIYIYQKKIKMFVDS